MGGCIIGVVFFISNYVPSIITLGIGTGIGCIIYFLSCRLLHVKEIMEIECMLMQKLQRKI